MLCCLQNEADRVSVTVRAESEDGAVVGDANWSVYPGEDFYGVAYDALRDIAENSGVIDV